MRPKASFITTVLNEEKTIEALLVSLIKQTQKPDEIIIVDGGSRDRTVQKAKAFRAKHPQANIKILIKNDANRSRGRNLAIQRAKNDVIAISDAGCQLDKNWLKNIIRPFSNPSTAVVAGYYQAKPKNIFEKCVVPYVLVMPNRVNPKNFLPASRSMAIRKDIWTKVGGFPEKFSDNEDFVFANILKKKGVEIVFAKDAIVYWQPRSNLKNFWVMAYRFARGDALAGLRYPKTATVIGRYLLALILLLPSLHHRHLLFCWLFCALTYLTWPIFKNYRYIKKWPALFLLPLLQVTTDTAIILGTMRGLSKRLFDFR